MAIDESSLTKGQMRKLTALRKSIGTQLADDAFGKWLTLQVTAEAPKSDPMADRLVEIVTAAEGDKKFNLGLYGYTVRRAKGKGRSGFIAEKNVKH